MSRTYEQLEPVISALDERISAKAEQIDALDTRVTAVEGDVKEIYTDTNSPLFWEVGGLGSAGEDYDLRTTSIRTKSYLHVSNYKKIVTGNSFTAGYLVLYTNAFVNVVRLSISGNNEYVISSLLTTYPTAEYLKFEIGEVAGDVSCYNYISLLSTISAIYNEAEEKRNAKCNNLVGTVFEKLYPVDGITEGTVITISTSDGQNLGGTVQIGFYDENKQYLDYISVPVSATKRTVTLSADMEGTRYIALINSAPRVPLMVNVGSTALPYEEYFENAPELTEKVLDLADDKANADALDALDDRVTAVEGDVSGVIENKQNKTCNNLIGNDFDALYPVSLEPGMYLTFSTSDGAALGSSPQTQTNIAFYDENKNYIDFYGFPPAWAKRTVGPLTDEINSAKYLGLQGNPPRVPLMVNIGNEVLPYEEYFEDLPTVTETLLGVVKNVQDLNDLVGGVADVKDLLSQSKYVYVPTDSGVDAEKTLTLMHISDMHGNRAGMDYALELYDKYSDSIDDIIHTGDTVATNLSDGITNWINSGCAEKVLNVIGNHDTEENLVLQAAGKDNVYNTIFAPYISGWGVTQPTDVDDSTSGDYHALYYYKDYAEAKVRLIVCDTNFWDNAQKTWLTSTLAGAKTLDYAVVLACHDVKKLTELTTANFSSYNGDGINEGNGYANQPDNWLDPVKDFMDDGGHFVCILAGHDHNGHMGYMTYYPDIFVYVAQKSSMNRVSGTARILGESNQNTVSIVTINPTEKLFKLFSIGAQVDGHLRQRHVFCYNYETKTIISQW